MDPWTLKGLANTKNQSHEHGVTGISARAPPAPASAAACRRPRPCMQNVVINSPAAPRPTHLHPASLPREGERETMSKYILDCN